ncbi:hypothetical protein SAMN05444920_118214 [Nonomuraea solani]|uniref:Uncharacterized protein n=1 Tax=Nonomuraea solani TaxID=1144553 RepID=A0A1H6EVS9_9ACTN|nr:hypothetical protein [Nonomuraea solani]SEH01025.1 hypothetical protein SAMN05444920_118214 [Nonomuraea solani]
MTRFEPYVEELLDFLLKRLDEAGFERLLVHEPRRMYAPYIFSGGGRVEQRGLMFTGCRTCSRIPEGGFNVEAWPCAHVLRLTLRFADDPGHHPGWRPENALFASGRLIHPDDAEDKFRS